MTSYSTNDQWQASKLFDSAYELRQEIADEAAAKAGGLREDEDLFASVRKSAKNRGIWSIT